MLEIPRALAPDGAIDASARGECSFHLIGQDYLSGNSVIKASFHPMSNTHVVVLIKGSLLLIDISTPNGETQFIPLGVSHHFVSFCFGPSIDWMMFTIFLISNKKSEKAEIYCLCPVIPKDVLVPKNSVRDLWAWIDEQVMFRDDRGDRDDGTGMNSELNVQNVKQYVTTAFGPRNLLEKDEINSSSSNSYVRAGEYMNSGGLRIEMEGLLSAVPSLQGPFLMADQERKQSVRKHEKYDKYDNYDGNDGNEKDNKNAVKASRSPTDICVPVVRGEGAPLLVVSYDNGDVDFFIVGSEVGGRFSATHYLRKTFFLLCISFMKFHFISCIYFLLLQFQTLI